MAAGPLTEDERARAAQVATYLIWRVEPAELGDDPESTPIAVCLSAPYAEQELAKRRAVFARLRFERSGPSSVLHDYDRHMIDAAVARRLLEKYEAGERGTIELGD